METHDYYGVLGVKEDADEKSLRNAYRELAFRYHPDRNQDAPEVLEKMKAVNEAYAVLSNAEKRREYDTMRRRFGDSASREFRQAYTEKDIFDGSDIAHVFEEMARAFNVRGTDDVFREFYGPGYRRFEFRGPGMHGRGFVFTGRMGRGRGGGRCRRVAGGQIPTAGPVGRISRFLLRKIGGIDLPEDGRDVNDVIRIDPDLAARGGPYAYYIRNRAKKVVVKIPAGIRPGQKIRLAGQGEAGTAGGRAGDLLLKVEIRRPLIAGVRKLIGRVIGKPD